MPLSHLHKQAHDTYVLAGKALIHVNIQCTCMCVMPEFICTTCLEDMRASALALLCIRQGDKPSTPVQAEERHGCSEDPKPEGCSFKANTENWALSTSWGAMQLADKEPALGSGRRLAAGLAWHACKFCDVM